MTVANSRENWLTTLLGPERGAAVQQMLGRKRVELQAATTLLDEAGMERKSVTKADGEQEQPPQPEQQPPAPPPPPDENDPVLQVAGKLVEDVKAAVDGDYSKLTDETFTAMLADAMRAAMPGEEPAEEAAPPTNQEEEPPMAEDSKSLDEATKAFSETFAQMVKDQGDLARSQQELLTDVKAVKELLPVVASLVEDLKQIRAEMGLKPRAASESKETELDDTTEVAKSVKQEMDKGLQGGEKIFLGQPVNNIPK